MTEPARFDDGHEHDEQCAQLYAAWRRYHAVVLDPAGRYGRPERLAAAHERDTLERQLRSRGCSGEVLRRLERDAEIAQFGHPTL